MTGLAPHSRVALTCPLLFLSLSFSRSGPWAPASLHFSVVPPALTPAWPLPPPLSSIWGFWPEAGPGEPRKQPARCPLGASLLPDHAARPVTLPIIATALWEGATSPQIILF